MATGIINRYDFDTVCAGILRLISDRSLFSRYKRFLDPQYFFYNDTSKHVRALRRLIEFLFELDKYGETKNLTVSYFDSKLNTTLVSNDINDEAKLLFRKMKNDETIVKKSADDGCFKIFIDYLKIIQMAKASGPFYEEYHSGRIDEAADKMQRALSIISTISEPDGIEFDAKDLISILQREHRGYITECMYLGCEKLDQAIGGFEIQTLNVFMSQPNGGKSMMTHHLLKRCIEEKKRCHVTFVEDRMESALRRLTAALTGIPTQVLKNNFKNLTSGERALVEEAQGKIAEYIKADFVYGKDIDIVHKRKLEYDMDCRMKGIPAPIVDIVDYTGHVASKAFGEKTYEKMRNAYAARKDFSLQYNKICFDFAQINREGNKRLNDSKVLTLTDLAGSYDLSQVCDNMISINRDDIDKSQFKAQLHVCKARDGIAGVTFRVGTKFHVAQWNMADCVQTGGPTEFSFGLGA